MKILTVISIMLVLCGCAPATYLGLKANHAGSEEFDSNINYLDTYKLILLRAKRCFSANMITAELGARGKINRREKVGIVTIALKGALGTDTHLGVEVQSTGENSSHVTSYYAVWTWKKVAQSVRKWVLEDSYECG